MQEAPSLLWTYDLTCPKVEYDVMGGWMDAKYQVALTHESIVDPASSTSQFMHVFISQSFARNLFL